MGVEGGREGGVVGLEWALSRLHCCSVIKQLSVIIGRSPFAGVASRIVAMEQHLEIRPPPHPTPQAPFSLPPLLSGANLG